MSKEKYVHYYVKDSTKEFEEPYSDDTLITAINTCAAYIPKFDIIKLDFSWSSDEEYDLRVYVSMGKKYIMFGESYSITIRRFNILEDTYDDTQNFARKIKRMLKKEYPEIKVTSNLRLR